MNSVEINENSDVWFKKDVQWPQFVLPVARRKLVLLIPHPDDEIVGCASLLQQWAPVATETVIIYVTAGDTALGSVDADEKASLARLRRQESQRTLEALDLPGDVRICELNIPSSEPQSFETQLEERLRYELDSSCVVIAPYSRDGRSDHVVVGSCAKHLAEAIGFEIYYYPVWIWFGDAETGGKTGLNGDGKEQDSEIFSRNPLNQRQVLRSARAMEGRARESQPKSGHKLQAMATRDFSEYSNVLPFEIRVMH